MSVSFPRRARYFTFAGLATLTLGAFAQLAVAPAASSADAHAVTLHQDPPITNSQYSSKGDCPGSPAQWGWHFVLPTNDDAWVSLTATFQTAGTLTLGPSDFPSPTKHAYLYTPTDDTLLSASGTATGGDDTTFNLSHVCAGGGTNETPSPTPTVSPTTVPPTTEAPSETPSETPTTVPPTTEAPSETPTTVPPTTEAPSETPSETPTTVPPTTVPPTTEAPSETPSAEVSATETTTSSPTPGATVLPTRLTNTPTTTPSVQGVKTVRGSGLPTTGTPVAVSLLLLLGIGLIGAGAVATVAGEPRTAGGPGKHRR
jgi:hypothetical protein